MKILIIKHGALGDMINAMGAFSAIRLSFPSSSITLLTGAAYEKLAKETGFFNEVWVDKRSKNPFHFWEISKKIKKDHFDWVFDLQNSARTSWYFRLLGSENHPKWSGIAPGCSHPQSRSDRKKLHAFPRFADQLKSAGLDLEGRVELYPDMSWLKANIERFNLPEKFIVLVPGSSKKGAYKRWPAQGYGELAEWIKNQDITPVLIGGNDELEVLNYIKSVAPYCLDLSTKTSFLEIGEIQKHALATVGNDTGPVHLAAALKCPSLVLWSKASPFEVFAPRGNHVKILFEPELAKLPSSKVIKSLHQLLRENSRAK
jgi:ADP-heptose:LPS heptosyltransferase